VGVLAVRLLVVLAALVVAAPAAAQEAGVVERAARELQASPVYVHPDASTITAEQADELRDRIAQAGGGIFVAVLPEAALEEAGSAEGVLNRIASDLRRPGAYAVVVGRQFRARRVGSEQADVRQIANEAVREHSDEGVEGIGPALLVLVDGVAQERAGGDAGAAGEEDDGSPGGRLAIVVAIVVAVIGLFALRRRRRESSQFGEVKEAAEEDLLALGDDIRALDLDVEMPDVDPRAREDYGQALAAYERASSAFRRARRPADLEEVSAALEEGRYAMTAAKARLEGRDPPEHRPPCFFDPRHGPSVRDVEWAPPGGEPRLVPACAADAIRVEEGEEPEARQVLVGGARTPYWNAGPAYGPWAGGFFGGAAGALLPMLFVGSMLGSGFGGSSFGGEAGYGGDEGFEDGDDIGGGDFDAGGGGDFGGGDVGGGDFGGGGDF
jgi:hypothetical protein